MNIPKNKKLYNQIKNEAKKKFDVYPSIYASSWIVKKYKNSGGLYLNKKYKNSGLEKWFSEKWIDVCQLPKIVPCGRQNINSKYWKKSYPYCRPTIKIDSNTPVTIKELSKNQISKRCKLKKNNPLKILYPKQHSLEKSRRRVEKSRRRVEKSRRRVEKSRRSVEKSRRRVEKSRRSVEKSRRSVEKPRRSVEKPRRRVEKPRRRVEKSRRRVEKSTRRVEKPRRRVEKPRRRVEKSRRREIKT